MNVYTVTLALALVWLLWPTQDNRPRVVNGFWYAVALIVTLPRVKDWIVSRAMSTPYWHLPGYMNRYWLFNPNGKIRWLPSIRVHHILRRDHDRHPHNHPWSARTIILDGFYWEKRGNGPEVVRMEGDTAVLTPDDYHRITQVSADGVWTLFFTFGGPVREDEDGSWGFLENGKYVPWREYKRRHPEGPWGDRQ